MTLKIVGVENGTKNVYAGNDVYIGDFVCMVDGYYVYFPDDKTTGYWSEGFLLEIAAELRKLNKEWDDIVQNDASI
jgi:hypothetical protein